MDELDEILSEGEFADAPAPSAQIVIMDKRLIEALEILGVRVLEST